MSFGHLGAAFGRLGSSSAPGNAAPPAPWQPWAATRGVLVNTFQDTIDGEYQAWSGTPGQSGYIAPGRLEALRTAGFDHVGLAVSPTPLLSAADDTALDAELVTLKEGLDACVGAGLNVVFRLQFNQTDPDWNAYSVTENTAGAKFQRLLHVAEYVSAWLASNYSGRAAILPFNEPPPPVDWSQRSPAPDKPWDAQAAMIWDACRAGSAKIGVYMSGSNFSKPDGFSVFTDVSRYDANTYWASHHYLPAAFTLQHQSTVYLYEWLQGIRFPPAASDKAAAISAATANINASGMSSGDKAAMISAVTTELNGYYASQYYMIDGGTDSVQSWLADLAGWADSRSIDRSKLSVAEFGVRRGVGGANDIDAAVFLQRIQTRAFELGFGSTCAFNIGDRTQFDLSGDDVLNDNLMVALGGVPVASYDSDAASWFDAMAVKPPAARLRLLDAGIKLLKAGGAWDALDALYLMFMADEQSCLLNVKSPAVALVKTGGVTFTADRYAQSTGGYLTDPTVLGTGQLAQNSAHLGVWQANDSGAFPGAAVSDNYYRNVLRMSQWESNYALTAGSDPASTLITVGRSDLHHVLTRADASNVNRFVDGNLFDTQSSTSAALGAGAVMALFRVGSFAVNTDDRILAAHWGAALTPDQVQDTRNAIRFWAQGVGAL